MGASIDSIITSLESIKVPGRSEVVPNMRGYTILVDYAHTPNSLENIIRACKTYTKGEIICVFGCGGDRDKEKRPVMGQIANELADVVFITDDNPRNENPDEIRNEIFKGCPKAYNIAGREKAIKEAFKMLEENDILILAGKGHEKYIIMNKEKIPFDEKQIVQECINNEP